MLTILTRIGMNNKYIFLGDKAQCDVEKIRKNPEKEMGLIDAINKLKDLPEVGIIEFTDDEIVRNPVISKILSIW